MNQLFKKFSKVAIKRNFSSTLALKNTRVGAVKWFNQEKGYGFLTQSNGDDMFVHISGFSHSGMKSLDEGEQVEFEIGEGRQGPIAINVRYLEEDAEEKNEE